MIYLNDVEIGTVENDGRGSGNRYYEKTKMHRGLLKEFKDSCKKYTEDLGYNLIETADCWVSWYIEIKPQGISYEEHLSTY